MRYPLPVASPRVSPGCGLTLGEVTVWVVRTCYWWAWPASTRRMQHVTGRSVDDVFSSRGFVYELVSDVTDDVSSRLSPVAGVPSMWAANGGCDVYGLLAYKRSDT